MANKVLVETSARHIHVSREHLDILFGEGYELTIKKMLSQPGQYACAEQYMASLARPTHEPKESKSAPL